MTSAAGKSTSRSTDYPCLPTNDPLGEAVLGHGKYIHWRAVVSLLEGRGFPKIDGLMGGRYVPAVKAFFDWKYGIGGAARVLVPDGPENLGA